MRKLTHYLNCKECDHENNYTEYKEIIIDQNPEMREVIMSDNLFLYQCDHCQHQELIFHDFTYFNNKEHFCIVFCEDINESLSRLKRDNSRYKEYKTVRISDNWYIAKEKIQLFEHHYDDRIIELYKYLVLEGYKEENPLSKNEIVFFQVEDDEEYIMVMSENLGLSYYEFDKVWYQERIQDEIFMKTLHMTQSLVIGPEFADAFIHQTLKEKIAVVDVKGNTRYGLFPPYLNINIDDLVSLSNNEIGIIKAFKMMNYSGSEEFHKIETVFSANQDMIFETQKKLEELMNEIQETISTHQLNEFMQLVSDATIYTLLHYQDQYIADDQDHHFLPVFTNSHYADERIIEKDFLLLIEEFLDREDIDAILINPYSSTYFVLDKELANLIIQYQETTKYQIN